MFNNVVPIKILLVEDNPGDIELTLIAFKESDLLCEITVIDDGQDALDHIFKRNGKEGVETPDLILLDINLPRVNGIEILEKIKTSESTKVIPVIVLTTSNEDRDVFRAYSSHVNAYLNKPIDFVSFVDAINIINQFWFALVRRPQ